MKKVLTYGLVILVIFIIIGLGAGVNYLFNYAIVAGKKDFINDVKQEKIDKDWQFSANRLSELSIKSDDGLKLVAKKVTHDTPSKKVAIVAHGYMGKSDFMGQYAQLFYDEGFDVLVPDNRAHGKSEGKYVGFGWLDRNDYVKWINTVIKEYGEKVDIVLYGLSMGAATVMMTSGEELPNQVKVIIEDCGYDSVDNELAFQLNDMFHLPAFPMIPLASGYTKLLAGYSFSEASAVKQLEKNTLPMLFIHGDKDDFVPEKMVYEVYNATKGPKELVIFEGAKHADSLKKYPEEYKKTIETFLAKYFPK
ncbi:alpha/beta hydrolase [Vagococcus bubulae]|uniref:Alpha/beta hydrolase n=1 Tax=Vagococcus bubulae TaxID=1977868 RepID=A0A429ZG47_9ENTE|nr:alpha/beta hydrolase [Vagococcus bubulae]RST92692.1 alpha/beta hydrolase [Vagococcus bubulae]